jgi:hypothetical protein
MSKTTTAVAVPKDISYPDMNAISSSLVEVRRPAKAAFAEVLGRAAVAYRESIDKAFYAVAFEAMQDLDIRDIEYAVSEHVKTSKWFPKIAELRELAHGHFVRRREEARELAKREAFKQAEAYKARRVEEVADAIAGWAGPPASDEELIGRVLLLAERDGRYMFFGLRTAAVYRTNEGVLVIGWDYLLGLHRDNLQDYLQEAAGKRIQFMFGVPPEAEKGIDE